MAIWLALQQNRGAACRTDHRYGLQHPTQNHNQPHDIITSHTACPDARQRHSDTNKKGLSERLRVAKVGSGRGLNPGPRAFMT